jgi:two-component system, sensor histidine kinase and response regulator
MGGTVCVESEVGTGSRFSRRSRSRRALRHADRSLGIWQADSAGRRSRGEPRQHLDQAQHVQLHDRSVGSVDEALEILALDPGFDLVLADELMPQRGGLDLLAALRADPRLEKMPFILMSLFSIDEPADGGALKPDAFAMKPMRGLPLAMLVRIRSPGSSPAAIAGALAPHGRASATFPGKKVLLVEDNPVNQRVAQRILAKLGVEVTIASNGAEALERVAAARFDAVLMDCQMPVMDGFTASRKHSRSRGAARRPASACRSSR